MCTLYSFRAPCQGFFGNRTGIEILRNKNLEVGDEVFGLYFFDLAGIAEFHFDNALPGIALADYNFYGNAYEVNILELYAGGDIPVVVKDIASGLNELAVNIFREVFQQ